MLPCRRAGIFYLSGNGIINEACAEKAKKVDTEQTAPGTRESAPDSPALQHWGLQPDVKAERTTAVCKPGRASAPQPGHRVLRRALLALCEQPKAVRLSPAHAAGLSTLHTSRKARAGAHAASL